MCFLFFTDGAIYGSPAIDQDGTIYIGSYRKNYTSNNVIGSFYALNPDGTERWRIKTG